MEPNIRLCEAAHSIDVDVLRIYEGAFPASEREPLERLSALLAEGKLLYHRTLNEQGELLCFTFVSLADDFSFLAYMATDPTKRSGGIGTRHLKRLVELLKDQFPQHIGMFFEIEATNPKAESLSQEDLTNRKRRRMFYERAGARVLCENGVYLTPKYGDERNKEWEGELMGFLFGIAGDAAVADGNSICSLDLTHIIRTIYLRFYQLPVNHPLVTRVLGSFADCQTDCSRKGDPADGEADSGAQAPPARQTWLSWLLALLRRWFG